MKKYRFLIAALAAGMFTACSDNAAVDTDTGGAAWNADGTGYVSLSINLPTAMSDSRADNDIVGDGTANEYAVHNATLLLFAGSEDNEANAKFQGAYRLAVPTFLDGSSDQITTTAQITRKINETSGDYIYAYVALNAIRSDLFEVAGGNESTEQVATTTLKIDGQEVAVGTTFSAFQDLTASLPTTTMNGLVMVNAPLTSGGSVRGDAPSGKVTTLAKVDKNNIRHTQSEATSNPAATIYVERSVAKVEFLNETGDDPQVTGTPEDVDIPYQILGYRLDNINTTSYITRNADETAGTTQWQALRSNATNVQNKNTGYRFVGHAAVADGVYRTYWARDVNYDVSMTDNNANKTSLQTGTDQANFLTAGSSGFPVSYCMENTFDVERMTRANTTRLIVQVHFGEANNNADYMMYNEDMRTYKMAGDEFNNQVLAVINRIPAVQAKYDNLQATKVHYTGDETSNRVEIKAVVFGSGDDEKWLTDQATGDNLTLFNLVKNTFGTISVFRRGIGYYQVRIKHFGDELTPWNGTGNNQEWTTQPTTWGGTGVADIYPGNAATQNNNYLGRYGVVRNNWYQVAVSAVKKIGTPDIPPVEDDNTPDDELDSYISVNINILAWAVRKQSEVLQ